MNLSDNNKYQLLDDFMSGGMNTDDLDKFRAFLQSDADLALDHQIISELKEAKAFAPAENDLRSTLDSIRIDALAASDTTGIEENPRIKNGQAPQRKSKYRVMVTAMAMAATLLLLLTVFFPQNGNINNTDAYEQYAMIEPLQLAIKSDESPKMVTELQDAYNAQDYATALPIIENYLENAPRDLDVMLAKGIALTEISRFAEADVTFDQLAALSPRLKKYQWHKAMSLIKQDKIKDAKALLNDLVATKAYNHRQAKELLANLK